MPDIFTNNTTPAPTTKTVAQKIMQPKTTVGLFSSFCQNPDRVSFKNQDEDEVTLLFLRAHFITNISWIIMLVILALLPLFLSFISNLFDIDLTPPFTLPDNFMNFALVFYYLCILMYAFLNFMTWFYNCLLVTNKRVVDIDFSDLVYHDLAETKHELIQDVSYSQTGFLPSLFNFGDVIVQTAAEKAMIESYSVPHPQKAVDIIGNIIGGKKKK